MVFVETMRRHTGIILKKLATNKVALLDRYAGRIDLFLFDDQSSVGALMQYQIHHNQHYASAESVVFDSFAPVHSYEDLLFIHHVIELCYFFIPVNSSTNGVFELVHTLYTRSHLYQMKKNKKYLIYQLLLTIGFYPEWKADSIVEKRLAVLSIDTLDNESIDLECEQFLHRWLLSCIRQHPRFSEFKTIHFFNQE